MRPSSMHQRSSVSLLGRDAAAAGPPTTPSLFLYPWAGGRRVQSCGWDPVVKIQDPTSVSRVLNLLGFQALSRKPGGTSREEDSNLGQGTTGTARAPREVRPPL
ncbi:hypothetical protein NDU88_007074 [Pleurodeles waltl]|uniref:Uncharacterized protein n=1 Tax=Pleurodeles waltl TaxID=8319 RepID=A0AAV7LYS6_PLEWA|nr:hypothetical protein NDU88_007074 [Pleurodeles waltl]